MFSTLQNCGLYENIRIGSLLLLSIWLLFVVGAAAAVAAAVVVVRVALIDVATMSILSSK